MIPSFHTKVLGVPHCLRLHLVALALTAILVGSVGGSTPSGESMSIPLERVTLDPSNPRTITLEWKAWAGEHTFIVWRSEDLVEWKAVASFDGCTLPEDTERLTYSERIDLPQAFFAIELEPGPEY